MKLVCIFCLFLICITNCKAQNLVPNWSFELIDSCPPGHNYGPSWVLQNWNVPPGSITTPDLFSTCYNGTTPEPPFQDVSVPLNFMGFTEPKTGANYSGALLRYGTFREYLQVQLNTPLIAGQNYRCGFHVQLADSSMYQIDKIGMHISTIPEYQNTNQAMSNLTPQIENQTGIMYDSINWLNIEEIYTAIGGEQYITLGNFYTNENTLLDSIDIEAVGSNGWHVCCRGYYLFDDVYIYPYNENLEADFPDQVCKGETITLSANGSAKYNWYINGVLYLTDSSISIEANNNLQITVAGYEDSIMQNIEVIDCPVDCNIEPIIPNIFTPNNDNSNDFFSPTNIDASCYSLTILNRWGDLIYKSEKNDIGWDGTTSNNGKEVNEGVYFYILAVTDNYNEERKYRGYVTLLK